MQFLFFILSTTAFFSAVQSDDKQHFPGIDFGIDMVTALSKDGVKGLVDVALKGQTGVGALVLKSMLSLMKNEPKAQETIKDHKDKKAHSAQGTAPQGADTIKPLSDKAVALLKKIEDIKKAGGTDEAQEKKIKELVHQKDNKATFAEISEFLKNALV
uniref:Secreted protein n=1 Tax=Strongyloides venezuelensis TaxID=75913 RepID=A0A0K0FB10_STRVS